MKIEAKAEKKSENDKMNKIKIKIESNRIKLNRSNNNIN